MKSDLPKVLQPLAGRPLLQHVIDTTLALEPTAIHVVYGHGGDTVRGVLKHAPVSWVLQEQQLGTGHAVTQAIPAVPDDHLVLVLYGDVPLISIDTLRALLTIAGPETLALLTVDLADPTGYGRVIRNSDGGVAGVVEHKDASAQQRAITECNTGVLAAPANLLKTWLRQLTNTNSQGEYYLTDVIGMAAARSGGVRALLAATADEVLGVNDKVQLAAAEAVYRREAARTLMLNGVTLADPARVDVRGTLTHGRDVSVDINVIFEGTVKLGSRVSIGPNCMLRDADIGDDTQIHANSVIDKAVVAENCVIGPFARLRPGAALEQGAHIGNFVEVKNTRVGRGSKANHLTYLGDARIGEGVNIGAGTVTCNYDGVNKSLTEIGDGAFVGSGSMLVAPVVVGKGATIGAGSTIVREAPEDQLTIARARQVVIEGWQRPVKKKS